MRGTFRKASILITPMILLALYQNCSDVGFSRAKQDSSPAVVESANSGPAITLYDQTVNEGEPVRLEAQIDRFSASQIFIWSKDGTTLSSTTEPVLEIEKAELSDDGDYTVQYFDDSSYLGSDSGRLTVIEAQADDPAPEEKPDPVKYTAKPSYSGKLVVKYGIVVSGSGAAGGGITGLGYTKDSSAKTVAGKTYTACAKYKFPKTMKSATVSVYSRSVRSISGDSCVGSYCGTGTGARLFVSSNGSSWKHLGTRSSSSSSWGKISSKASNVRYALLCRSGHGYARNNVQFKTLRATYYE